MMLSEKTIMTILFFLVCSILQPVLGQMDQYERSRLEQFRKEYGEVYRRDQQALKELAKRLNIPMLKVVGKRTYLLRDIINGHPVYDANFNLQSQKTSSANRVKDGGDLNLGLSGKGINLGIWEAFEDSQEALPRESHVEFGGRAELIDGGSYSDHATHVAGTMIAQGVSGQAQGFSSGANLFCFDLDDDLGEMMDAALGLPPIPSPILVSNHSYGTLAGWQRNSEGEWVYYGPSGTTEDWLFGAYTSAARKWDATAYYANHLLIVKAAGNDRSDPPDTVDLGGIERDGGDDGFECIPTYGTAKNIVTVGAIFGIVGGYSGPYNVYMSSFSSWGPTDDGRIKPDLVAQGTNLKSAGGDNDSDYFSDSGTSMAAPSVSGGAGLFV
jgi:subtilisin family serine protease